MPREPELLDRRATLREQVRIVGRLRRLVTLARGLSLVHGVLAWSSVSLLLATVVAMGAFLTRQEGRDVQWLLAAGVWCGALLAAQRFLFPAFLRRPNELGLAVRAERLFPELGDCLSNAVGLLTTHEAGQSLALRAAVVREAVQRMTPVPLSRTIDWRTPGRGLAWAVVGLAVVGGAAGRRPDVAWCAALRLTQPWVARDWPRRHLLFVVQATDRIAPGARFSAQFADRNGLPPPDAMMLVRYRDDPPALLESQPLMRQGRTLRFELEQVTRPFHYRVVGGDDDRMEWRKVELVEPPRLSELTVEVQPPAYSGLPRATVTNKVRVLSGSGLSIRGRLDRGVETLRLIAARSTGQELVRSGRLRDEGREFDFLLGSAVAATDRLAGPPPDPAAKTVPEQAAEPLVVHDSVRLVLEGEHAAGVATGPLQTIDVQVLVDQPPTLVVASPWPTDYFLPTAELPFRCEAGDDLAVREVRLEFPGGQRVVTLPDRGVPSDGQHAATTVELKVAAVDLPWSDGESLAAVATARDALPQDSQPVVIPLVILATDRWLGRFQGDERAFAERLRTAIELQIAALITPVVSVSGDPPRASRADWSAVHEQQLQVARRIQGAADSLLFLAECLRRNAALNLPAADPLRTRWDQIHSVLDQLRESELALLADDLSYLATQTEPARVATDWQQRVQDVAAAQQRVLRQLEAIAAKLSSSLTVRRAAEELANLARQQRELRRETEQLPTLGRNQAELSPAERAELDQLARRIQEVAGELTRLRGELSQTLGQPAAGDDVRAAAASAIAAAERHGIETRLGEASREIQQNHVGNSAQAQADAEAGLEAMVAALRGRSGQSESPLRFSVQQLQELYDRQLDVMRRTEQLTTAPNAASEPTSLAEQTRKLGIEQHELEQLVAQMLEDAAAPAHAAAPNGDPALPPTELQPPAQPLPAANAQRRGDPALPRPPNDTRGAPPDRPPVPLNLPKLPGEMK